MSALINGLNAGVSVNSGDRPANPGESGILKTSAVTNGVFDPLENKVVFDSEELKRLKEPVTKNTIIISRMNTPALVGANAYVEISHKNLFLPDRLWAAKPKPETSMRFIACILGSEKGKAALSELATGTSGSMKNIKKADVLELQILVPSLIEQQKIADCLFSLDTLITAQAEKIDALNSHKKGLMQQLFPREGESIPRRRFPEFRDAGEWEEVTLGKCLSRHPEYGINAPSVPYADNLPTYLRITDISHDGYIRQEQKVSVAKNVTDDNYLEDGDIVLARTGASVGKAYRYRVQDGKLVFAGFLIRIRPHRERLNPEFLFQFLSTEQYWRWVVFSSARSGQPGINGNEYASLPIPMPPSQIEQKEIADCFSSLDVLIATHTEKLEALKAHKKGLTQQLFPIVGSVE